jgi:hypothetical protein
MEINQLINPVSGLFVMAVTYYVTQHWPANKTKAELLQKLDVSIKNNCKHSAGEIFYMIHKVKMNFQDIKTLIEDDNSSSIISVLKHTPGLANYKNGQFRKIPSPKWLSISEKIFLRFLFMLFLIFEILLTLSLPFVNGWQFFTILLVIVFVTIVIISIRAIQKDYNVVDELINSASRKKLDDSA